MAEIRKLPIDKVLDKLRSADPPKGSKFAQLDEEIKERDREIQRLREERHRLERDQRAAAKRDPKT